MIFIVFLLLVSLLLLSAYFAGDISTFINIDSIIIVLAGFILSSLTVAIGRYKLFLKGFLQIFKFSSITEKSNDIKNMFTAISIMTLAIGFCSTIQGLISGLLIDAAGLKLSQIICFASFTSVYSIIFVCFLLIPIIYLYKEP